MSELKLIILEGWFSNPWLESIFQSCVHARFSLFFLDPFELEVVQELKKVVRRWLALKSWSRLRRTSTSPPAVMVDLGTSRGIKRESGTKILKNIGNGREPANLVITVTSGSNWVKKNFPEILKIAFWPIYTVCDMKCPKKHVKDDFVISWHLYFIFKCPKIEKFHCRFLFCLQIDHVIFFELPNFLIKLPHFFYLILRAGDQF